MLALVVGAALALGEDSFYRELLARADVVVAADGAAESCVGFGRVPDVAVGDFDSSDPGAEKRLSALGVRVHVFPEEKDASDLDLAVDEAREIGATELTLTGAFSGRLDHTLAAIGTLLRCADIEGEAREPGFSLLPLLAGVRESVTLVGEPEATVSLLTPAGAQGVRTSGLVWQLDNAILPPMSSLGVSNRMAESTATIALKHGALVLVVGPTAEVASHRGS